MKKYIFIILLFIISSHTYACENSNREWSRDGYNGNHTVEGPYSIEEIESKHTYIPAGETIPVVFRSNNTKWIIFKEIYRAGDQLYYIKFDTSNDMGKHHYYKYIIVRNKCVVGKYLVSSKGVVE